MPFLLFLVGAIVLLLFLSGVYVFLVACVRQKDVQWLDREKIEKTFYAPIYDSIVAANNWINAHDPQEVFITSHDGLKLRALWIPAKNPKGTILFAHGYRSTYLADFGMALDFYYDQGLNLLLPDQRSHGKSEGRFITFGVKESEDMLSWLNLHNSQLAHCPVILSGLSMGASTMMYLADRDLPDNVKGVVVDCGFTSPKAILSSVFKSVTHLPPWLCMWSTGFCTRLIAGFGITQRDSVKTLQKNKLPIIMIHGTADSFVPCDMTRQGYAACGGPKKLFLAEGAEHGLSFLVEKDRYMLTVSQFVSDCLAL